MLCHVTRPDSVVMEVEVDAKANGEDCLNKVGIFIIIITFLKHKSHLIMIVAHVETRCHERTGCPRLSCKNLWLSFSVEVNIARVLVEKIANF